MIYFVSDVHLGTQISIDPTTHLNRFVNLLKKMQTDATHIFLLGDIFDFWFEYFWPDPSKKKYSNLFNILKDTTNNGTEVHFFTGNHDLWTFGYIEKKTGLTLHKTPYQTTLNKKKVYLAHGDGIVPSYLTITKQPSTTNNYYSPQDIKKIKRFMLLRQFHRSPIAQFCFRSLPPSIGNFIGKKIAEKGRIRELQHPCKFKGENKEELILFAKEHELFQHHDFYIFGHRHITLDFLLPTNSRVIILGDFFQQWTYATLNSNGELSITKDNLT